MGGHAAASATGRWLQWQTQKQVPGERMPEETLPHSFNLEGPIEYLRAGSSEVRVCYFGLGGNMLLFGPKWNVILDFLDLSHLKTSSLGATVYVYGGQDVVLRMFLRSSAEAEQWAEKLTAASFERLSDKYVAHLNYKIQKQQKAARRAQKAAAFGAFVEKLCSSGSAAAANARLKALVPSHHAPAAILGERFVYPARFYMKEIRTEGAGRISIHGDALIMQWSESGKVLRRAVVLTGATATIATFMVSVRGANGLAIVRLWMNSSEEADEIAKAIEETAKESSALIKRKQAPSASTMRRQLGAAAACLCNAALQAPWTLPRKILRSCSCSASQPASKKKLAAAGELRLDGKCHVLFSNTSDTRFCHSTLRDDMLWFGEKASISDSVLSLIGAKASAFDDMVAIHAPNGAVYRLWPDASAGTPEQWCRAIQAAGKQSAHLSKWEAMIKAEKNEAIAKAEVRRLDRARRFRNLGEKLIYLPAKLAGLVHADRRCAIEVMMSWQESSRLKMKRQISADASKTQQARFFRRADAGRALDRTLEVKGDVLFVFNEEGKMEKPVPLAGTTIYINQAIVSIWADGVMQARMFLNREDDATSWGAVLEDATKLLAEGPRVKRTDSIISTGTTASKFPLKVAAPPKMSHEDHQSSQKLQQSRSRRFYSDQESAKVTSEVTSVREAAVGA